MGCPGLACCVHINADNNYMRGEWLLLAYPSEFSRDGAGVPRGCLFPPPQIDSGENELVKRLSQ